MPRQPKQIQAQQPDQGRAQLTTLTDKHVPITMVSYARGDALKRAEFFAKIFLMEQRRGCYD